MLTLTGTQELLNQTAWLLPSSEDYYRGGKTGRHPDAYILSGLCLLSNYCVLFSELDPREGQAGNTVGGGLVSRKPVPWHKHMS